MGSLGATHTRIAIALAAFAAAVGAVQASGAATASDPARLVLQRSDFPAGTQWSSTRNATLERALEQAGIRGRAVGYGTVIPQGGTEDLLVGGQVIVLARAADARRVFASFRNPFPATTRDIVTLAARYGDEQVAIVTRPPVRADLRVRRGTVVWKLEIKWAGTDGFSRARALAELRTYAAKQKRRIGGS